MGHDCRQGVPGDNDSDRGVSGGPETDYQAAQLGHRLSLGALARGRLPTSSHDGGFGWTSRPGSCCGYNRCPSNFQAVPLYSKISTCRLIEVPLSAFSGSSGSGKSTLLDIIAGFERPTLGRVSSMTIGRSLSPGPIAFVIFQDVANALFPWLSVLEHVEFGLKRISSGRSGGNDRWPRSSLSGSAITSRSFPSELSGGMKQWVQIAARSGSLDSGNAAHGRAVRGA